MRFLSKQPYYDFRTLLYSSSRKDFEQECLRVLRVVHPSLRQVVESKTLDQAGLDLVEYGEEARSIVLGVQCKGFEVADFRSDQLRQCRHAVDSLEASGVRVRDYVLALNRHVDREGDRAALDEALNRLVAAGVCQTAVWLDPGALLQYTAEHVQATAEALIEGANRKARREHEERLGQGYYVAGVPFRVGGAPDRDPGRFLEALVGDLRGARDTMAAERAVDPMSLAPRALWAFVIGEFGFGKTSLLLGLTEREVGYPVYLPIARFAPDAFSNETSLARSILGVIRERPYDHDRLGDRFVVANLRTTLKARTDLVLLVDGLDEHPALYSSRGLAQVFSCFGDFGAPAVFSARAEFWKDRAGDLSAALGSNPNRQIVLEMQEWGRQEILEFVRRYRADAPSEGLDRFRATVEAGRYEKEYGDIPRRPLFLRMLVEDAARGEDATRGLADLYERYFLRKFVRDREGSTRRSIVSRPLAASYGGDRLAKAGKILRVLDRVAAEMVTVDHFPPLPASESIVRLDAEIDERRVEACIAEEGVAVGDTLELLQHSVLVPTGTRTIDGLHLRFAHRSFQEFFVARSILREDRFYQDMMGGGVRRFLDELRASDRQSQ